MSYGNLEQDLALIADLDRRRFFRWAAGGAGLALAGTSGLVRAATCALIPEETAGPFPADGSAGRSATGGINILNQQGIFRSDIRKSFGVSATSAPAGTPLDLTLTLVNVRNSCQPLKGYAIYVWHADSLGRYSLYSPGVTKENYLRGILMTDAAGKVTFKTFVPGCYSGRYPHVHFEVYPSLPLATSSTTKLRTSQLAFPLSMMQSVYANSTLYPGSASRLAAIPITRDMVFADSYALEMATASANTTGGYNADLIVGIYL